MNAAVIIAVIGAFVSVVSSLIVNYANRPKTKAEEKQINTAAWVAGSAELREWVDDRVGDAKDRAQAAESRAEASDQRAKAAEKRADDCSKREDELEAHVILAYGHIRKLNETIRQMGGTPPALPPELEEIWPVDD